MTSAVLIGSLLIALARWGGVSTQQPPPPAERPTGLARVYITATGPDDTPVRDLAPGDLSIREDDVRREVLAVQPATAPMQIVLLVDDTGTGIQHIREAVVAFGRILQGKAEFALIALGGRNRVVVDFTDSLVVLTQGVNRLSTKAGPGTYLLEAIQESSRVLETRDGERPVIVSLSLEGTELSNVRADRVLDALARSGAILHAVSIGKPTLKTMTPWSQQPTQSLHENLDENINRHAVLADGPRRSGGRLEQVVEVTGLPARLSQIAYELVDQLVVTYASPPAGGGRIEVDTTRRGVKLRAPQRTRQR